MISKYQTQGFFSKIILSTCICTSICTSLIFLAGLLLGGKIFAAEPVKTKINWEKGNISSTGQAKITVMGKGTPVDSNTGAPISINRARMDAYKQAREEVTLKLVRVLKNMKIDPERRLEDILQEDKAIQKRLSIMLSDSLIIKEYPIDFYSSRCEIILNFKDLVKILPYKYPGNEFPLREKVAVSTFYTGLIIDCRGLDIEPMLLPSVYNEDGLEIYGKYLINSTDLAKNGMISYCYNEKQAQENWRAGGKPYFTIAVKSIRSCPVVSDKDSRRILGHAGTRKNLKKCRVIFILNREE